MAHQGPSQYRPYYNPQPASYASAIDRPEYAAAAAAAANATVTDFMAQDYLEAPGLPSVETLSALAQFYALDYIATLIAQPFENAKILMQIQQLSPALAQEAAQMDNDEVHDDEEEEDEEPDYFGEGERSAYRRQTIPERRATDRRGYVQQNDDDAVTRPPWQLKAHYPTSLHTTMGDVWRMEGIIGSFKAANTTFVYKLMQEGIEGWLTGALSVLAGIPDPSLVLDPTSDGHLSLLVRLVAVSISAVLLAPLDMARTRIIATPASEPRGLVHTLRQLPSRFCPGPLVLPTILERAVPAAIQHLLADVFEPISSLVQLVVWLPLETLLRRAQMKLSPPRKPMVHLGAYTGMLGTPWWIARQEADGVFGLYRGWKAGVLGVAGVYGLGMLAASKDIRAGTEF
ncbi:hypothetical protein BCR37DRAFT_381823 [Protomyces lactucae-debilis]|uniref:Mitochondrial carrier domain-containing protein n=1 Tax=Protomyces lactucae-debilis TaxID=2754530 RepID=A0A1Y2F7R7_PROLT|nr:uncharacterized protein BCR37DRAFT_381823 [Protomyces lactucae-debilis]ORY78955.1 hypothetical protein BCR37DRAFT_381823 [Protomyces lactucae-debilis]